MNLVWARLGRRSSSCMRSRRWARPHTSGVRLRAHRDGGRRPRRLGGGGAAAPAARRTRLLVVDCVGTSAGGAGRARLGVWATRRRRGGGRCRVEHLAGAGGDDPAGRRRPAHLLGRVYAASRVISWGTVPLGAALAGLVADLTTVRTALGGASALAAVVLVWFVAGLRGHDLDAAFASPATARQPTTCARRGCSRPGCRPRRRPAARRTRCPRRTRAWRASAGGARCGGRGRRSRSDVADSARGRAAPRSTAAGADAGPDQVRLADQVVERRSRRGRAPAVRTRDGHRSGSPAEPDRAAVDLHDPQPGRHVAVDARSVDAR